MGRFVKTSIAGKLFICVLIAAAFIILNIYGLEAVFQRFFLEHQNPLSEAEFNKFVTFSWPHPVSVEKPTDTYRILGLADSFGVMGNKDSSGNITTAENYHYVLETLLQKEKLPSNRLKPEVVNLSVIQMQISDELQLLRRFGKRYHPDLVLHGFYVGNDFMAERDELVNYKGLGFRMPQCSFWCRLNSFSLLKIYRMKSRVAAEERRKKQESPQKTADGFFSQNTYDEVMGRDFLQLCRVDQETDVLYTVDEIRKEVQAMGARYVMVIHPAQIQVDTAWFQSLIKKFNLPAQNYDCSKPQKLLMDYCKTNGVLCLDLLPEFQSAARRESLYLLRDTHYNKAGNAVAAQKIRDFLRTYIKF